MEHGDPVEQFQITPLSEALGAEITGLDVSKPVGNAVMAELKDAIQRYGVLCFRAQNLTEPQQIDFSREWGPLEDFPEEDKTVAAATVYHVANVTADGQSLPETDFRVIFQKVNARWHTDSSYRYIPAYVSLLYGIEVMPKDAEGGRTGFSNMIAAYDALPGNIKDQIESLHMVHTYEFGRRLFPELPPVSKHEKEAVPPVSHPLVRVPVTG
jgi:taurine dioxygenase/alpha-ketoglutarate-dependent 2,4-dichlorophenoxyacetate dioxygenase